MQFIPSDHTYATDTAATSVWDSLNEILRGVDGIAYYKHPIISSTTRAVPDLTILARGFEPTVVKILPYSVEELADVTGDVWVIGGERIDSPLLELEDYSIALNHQFEQARPLRSLLKTHGVLIFPLVSEAEFINKFGGEATKPEDSDATIVFGRDSQSALRLSPRALSDDQWKLAKSVFQGLTSLNRGRGVKPVDTSKIGRAIRVLEREIALLDDEQHKVAVQIAPGPQRIRGLAGTGKTVVLAKKAAHLHQRYPDKRILFTFNTQSLYNQAQTLISQFYRQHSDSPPDFENGIHVRHGWGGPARPGVYSDLCGRVGRTPLTFNAARAIDPTNPFRAACNHAHQLPVEPYYDFILVDEAQDFPKEYFQLLAKLATPERRIYWAYDELQTLSATEIPDPAELFGRDAEGNPLVSLDGDDYGGVIEKDFVLHKSYRCPRAILMLAHGIGLGIHSKRGCVQMLGDKDSWNSIGYEASGDFVTGQHTTICRPDENSPNRVASIYTGHQPQIVVEKFASRPEEIMWIAESIASAIAEEEVNPEQIVVVALDARTARPHLLELQVELLKRDIQSTIPGLVNSSSEFAEVGRVTLSTVFRAKGNEAPVVYIFGFDNLYNYTGEIENRNAAFTSISRAKGWLRISGVGSQMETAEAEITAIIEDLPCFEFKFPDLEQIRRLDAETSRRRKEKKKARDSVAKLINTDRGAVEELLRERPELKEHLQQILREISDAN